MHLFELRSGLSLTLSCSPVVSETGSISVDIRTQKVVKGRSINMALSRRGRDALAYINCEDVIVRNGIPMHSRMLHDADCDTHAVPYGTASEHVSKCL